MNGQHRELKIATASCALLVALAGVVHAAGTGTLDRVSGWFPAGTNLTVTATPALYSQFDRWAGDTNGAAIAGAQISFDVDSALGITAVFKVAVTATNSVPHEWLANQDPNWTNNFEAAVTNDPDGDGFTTAEEYWAGTDPTNANSYLRIDSFMINTTNYRLIWAHARVDGSIPPIAVQKRSSMTSGSWTNVGMHPPANGTNFWDAPGQQMGFYRLCVTNMP